MSAVRAPGFRRLTLAWTLGNVGDSALLLTLAMWTKDLTGSNSAAGLVFLAVGLPVLIAPLGGHVADRVSRRRLLVVTHGVAALVVSSLVGVSSAGQVWLVYVVAFVYGCVGYTSAAAQSGLLRDMVDDDDLARANGVLTTIDHGLRLTAPLAGAGLYAFVGGWAVAVLTSLALAAAALVLATLRVDESPPAPAAERAPFWTEVSAGARHIRRIPALAQLTAVMAVAFGVTGVLNATNFAAIEEGLGLGTEFFGVLASTQGLGAVVGGVTAARLIDRIGERATVGVGLVLLAAGISTTATGSLLLVCIGVPLAGLGLPWMLVAYVTVRQRSTPARLQGRTSAAANMALSGPQLAATLAGAALVAAVDYRLVILSAAVAVLACAALLLRRGVDAAPSAPADVPPHADPHRLETTGA